LKPRGPFNVPVEAECVTPDAFAGKSMDEIGSLQIWEGNRKRTLGELFLIEGEESNPAEKVSIHLIEGLSKVRRIGTKMSVGEITVTGDVGMHLGEGMKGGTIRVAGNAGSWVGSTMKGGLIEIRGNAGDYVGAAYRGSTKGMGGGTIIIHGDAGNETGCFMRNGLIKILGNTGQFAGVHMKEGTIYVQGNVEARAGAQMLGGKIVIGGFIPSILPTFTIDSIKPNVKLNGEKVQGPFYRFIGDLADQGEGKLFISQTKNPQLNFYEKYL
jgi:formylmethanofuran dehydrogenase subunit C